MGASAGLRDASINFPAVSRVPACMAWMAEPTPLGGSDESCSSQVFEDSLIRMRTYCTGTGLSPSFTVALLPWAFWMLADGRVFHWPCGPPSKTRAFVPSQYSTWYFVA